MAKITLAKALLRRKELASKVGVLKVIQNHLAADVASRRSRLSSPQITRVPKHEGIDEVTVVVSKIDREQVDKEYNWHASRLRSIDDIVQKANYATEIEVQASAIADWDDEIPEDLNHNAKYLFGPNIKRSLSKLLKIRKDINEAMDSASKVYENNMIETKTAQKKATDGVDDLINEVKKITAGELMSSYYKLLSQQRVVDGIIHETNCSTMVDIQDSLMLDYTGK
jgi:hypothetical protein